MCVFVSANVRACVCVYVYVSAGVCVCGEGGVEYHYSSQIYF